MPREYISVELDRRIRAAAGNRCGYCLSPQRLVMARLEIEHLIPVVLGGTDEEFNLWLSCPLCNRAKARRIAAADPESSCRCSILARSVGRNTFVGPWTDFALRD